MGIQRQIAVLKSGPVATVFKGDLAWCVVPHRHIHIARVADGKLMLNVLMSVAQWEREANSERTQEAMDELKRRGVRMGAAPMVGATPLTSSTVTRCR